MEKKFKLSYLPQFEQDLSEVSDYIVNKLNNPAAALRLINETEIAIKKRLDNPLEFRPYKSKRTRVNDYYRINIKNYSIFYVILDDVMEVRRFVYSKRNLPDII